MKKIVTNFVATRGGNYQAQQELKDLIIKEFNLPDDWNKYIKFDVDYDKAIFYKGLNTHWDNRIAAFKLDGKAFEYSSMQRMKIVDAYVQKKAKVQLENEIISKRKKVESIFKHLQGRFPFEGRMYEVSLSLYGAKYQMLIQMINAKDNDEFKLLSMGYFKPALVLDINYDFENDTIVYNLNPIQFQIKGTINEIEQGIEHAKQYTSCIMEYYNTINLPISILKQLA